MEQHPQKQRSLTPVIVLQVIILLLVGISSGLIYTQVSAINQKLAGIGNRGGARAAAQEEPKNIDDWEDIIRDHNASIGPKDAPVTIIEFSDFQCPYCAKYHNETHGRLISAYGDKIRFVYKHLPLEMHPAAFGAAIGAQCALKQNQFWAYHDQLFQNIRSLGDDMHLQIGAQLGLGDAFVECYKTQATRKEVEEDQADATKAGARGTPMFLVNGKVIPGALPFESFKNIIDGLLAAK